MPSADSHSDVALQRLPAGGVRSVQRLQPMADEAPGRVAALYFGWLQRVALGLVRCPRTEAGGVTIRVLGVAAIRLTPVGAEGDGPPAAWRVAGGALARPGGQFTFERDDTDVVAALDEFRPRLPWWLYRWTQGPIHVWTMRRFARWLARRRRPSEEGAR